MYRHFGNTETPKDENYQKMMEQLDGFMKHLPSHKGRQLLPEVGSNCCHKHYGAELTINTINKH